MANAWRACDYLLDQMKKGEFNWRQETRTLDLQNMENTPPRMDRRQALKWIVDCSRDTCPWIEATRSCCCR